MSNSELREILGLLASTTNLTVKLQASQTLEQVANLITTCTDEKLQFQLLESIGTLIIHPTSELPETRYHAIKTLLHTISDDSSTHIPIILLSATSKCATKELITTLISDTVAPLRIHRCSWRGCTVSGPHKYLVGLQRCSQCKAAYYCCPGCARLDWSAGHKAVCKAIAAHKMVNPKSALMDSEIAYVAAALLSNISRNETACGKLAPHLPLMVQAACLLAREGEINEGMAATAACLADAVMNAAQDSLCRKALVKKVDSASGDVDRMPTIKMSDEKPEAKKVNSQKNKSGSKKKSASVKKDKKVKSAEEEKKEESKCESEGCDEKDHSPLFYVIEVLSKSPNEQLRKAAYGTVRNICFENHLQELIIGKEGSDVNVMTFLLSKIRGTKELSEDDKDGMSPALHAPRELEPSLECRKLILDALLLLACYRPSREVLITGISYPILRDYHTAEEDEEAKDKVSTIVDILARDSTGNGKCPIAKPLPRKAEERKEEVEEKNDVVNDEKKSNVKIEMLDDDSEEVATVKSGNDYKLQKEKEKKEAEAMAAAVAELEEI